MKQNKHSNIQKGILGLLLLFVFLVPISFSMTAPEVTNGGIAVPQLALGVNVAAAANPIAGLIDMGADVIGKIVNYIGLAIMGMAAMFTWLGGNLLDQSVKIFVLGMGDLINGEGLGASIDMSWKFIRDISNLAFIFGFIYTGIRTILDPDNSDYKRFLSKIIIGALLINFSLFFVKVIIDFANFTSIQIYNAMIVGDGTITTLISNKLGIISFYNIADGTVLQKLQEGTKGFTYYMMASIFLVVTGFVFAASALMLLIRFVTLIFIMVGSPILFAATVFPQTQKFATELWGKLLSSAFYVPVYLLLTLVSITLIGGINLAATGSTFSTSLVSPGPGTFGIILQFVVIIFFMIQSLLIANKFSITGAGAITSKTKMLIGASTAGLAARAGRATLGGLAARASDSDELKDKASQSGFSGWAARQRLKTYRGIGDASFDARNTDAGKSAKIGSGRKGGFASVKKEVTEAEEKFAKSLGEVKDSDIRVEGRKKEMEAQEKHVRHLQEELKTLTDKKARQDKSDEIEEAKHHVHEAKIKFESEKQRRILGSTYDKPESEELDTLKFQAEIMKDEVKKLWSGKDKNDPTKDIVAYNKLNEKEKAIRRDAIEKLNKEISETEDESKALFSKLGGDGGYAGGLENSTIIKSWPTGRLVSHNKSAGTAMRKAREKGFPKEKDDHGKGHDDHGGDDRGEEHEAPAPHPAPPAPPGGGGGGGHGPAPHH